MACQKQIKLRGSPFNATTPLCNKVLFMFLKMHNKHPAFMLNSNITYVPTFILLL